MNSKTDVITPQTISTKTLLISSKAGQKKDRTSNQNLRKEEQTRDRERKWEEERKGEEAMAKVLPVQVVGQANFMPIRSFRQIFGIGQPNLIDCHPGIANEPLRLADSRLDVRVGQSASGSH